MSQTPIDVTPIFTLIHQTSELLKRQHSADTPFFSLIILENPDLVPLFIPANQANSFDIISLTDFLTFEFSQYYDLAVLVLAEKNKPETGIAIQRCRDLFARHSLIFAPTTQDFVAFGFNKLSQTAIPFGQQSLLAWQFNLYDYKQLPDWLNSRFWANPEQWNKFRW